jgi:hypothetical protein
MRKILLAAFTFSAVCCFAQTSFKKNTLYGELAGTGSFLSVHYEKQVLKKEGLGIHIGAGLGGEKPVIPIGAVYLFALKHTKSFIETGLTISFADRDWWDDHALNTQPNPYKPAFMPSAGIRHHTSYGLMWRLSYVPVFTKYRNVIGFGGFSLGWRF